MREARTAADSVRKTGRTAVNSNAKDYRSYSFWLETCGDDLTPRPALDGSTEVDVAILGAGFTGLWTAYHLLKRDPSLNVLIVEREMAGFGASGRNGGWCVADFPVSPPAMRISSPGVSLGLNRSMLRIWLVKSSMLPSMVIQLAPESAVPKMLVPSVTYARRQSSGSRTMSRGAPPRRDRGRSSAGRRWRPAPRSPRRGRRADP